MENIKDIKEYWDTEHKPVLEAGTCPVCNYLFGVDWTYLDQVCTAVTCPMCSAIVRFE